VLRGLKANKNKEQGVFITDKALRNEKGAFCRLSFCGFTQRFW
jgi:hypothetical protein